MLGGVHIPWDKGLDGHSDADVLSHAIADAILGAIGAPDIGYFFPPSDESIKGISSMSILQKAAEEVANRGGKIINIDSSLIAEEPKILTHADAMKENISQALGLEIEQIGIKATTNERMGFVGKGEGMAAMAVASVAV